MTLKEQIEKPTGDWYCKNCGYLSAGRVTYHENCDSCHTPVEWHDFNEISALEKAEQIIHKQSEMLKVAKETLSCYSEEKYNGYNRNGSTAKQALATIEEMEE